jgi:hypothetical protein
VSPGSPPADFCDVVEAGTRKTLAKGESRISFCRLVIAEAGTRACRRRCGPTMTSVDSG